MATDFFESTSQKKAFGRLKILALDLFFLVIFLNFLSWYVNHHVLTTIWDDIFFYFLFLYQASNKQSQAACWTNPKRCQTQEGLARVLGTWDSISAGFGKLTIQNILFFV